MVNNTLLRKKLEEIQAQGKADRVWWDREKASIQSNFMKELDNETRSTSVVKSAKLEKGGSDEDAVLVEAGGPTAAGATGGVRKKKGKK